MSVLYIVSTPIGNLEDLTHRAARVLRDVARVLAEDTRHTAILFRRYGIATPLTSAHEHNEASRARRLVAWLDAGDDVALVSDAGTPLLSDPGARLVRAALEAGHDVVPVPGASAVLAALVASGLETQPFTFYGFLPRSGTERTQRLLELRDLPHTAVLYEAPSRLAPLIEALIEHCGVDRPAVIARELTKLHESIVRGSLAEVQREFEGRTVRGEIVVLLGGATAAAVSTGDAAALARSLLSDGQTARSAAREIARRLNMPRNEAYSLVLQLTEESPPD